MMNRQTLEVRKENWSETRVVTETLDSELAENEVLLKVNRFAITANNISYAGAGDSLGYWGFFPAEEGWGRIPAMGWADVVASAHPEIAVGERVWGFFPFSTHLKIVAGRVRPNSFQDISEHRAQYAPAYSQFDRASANPIYEEAREDQDSLLRALFLTSWLVEDFLNESDNFGGEACLITSASSKTSIALAYALQERGSLTRIGITSPRNVAFCEGLGCYDKVVTYADVEELDGSQPVVLVDMAGNAKVLSDLHHLYGDNMKYSCRIGMTHYTEAGSMRGLPGAKPTFFFAPSHIQTRGKEMGMAGLMMQLGRSYYGFRLFSDSWLGVDRSFGPDAVAAVYQSVLSGGADPARGQVVSMWHPE